MLNIEKMFELYKFIKEHLGNCKTEIDAFVEKNGGRKYYDD